MEVSIVAAHNLSLLSDLGGICAVPNKPLSNLKKNEFLPSYVRHGSVDNHKRCRLKARFFFGEDGPLFSLADTATELNDVNTPAVLLVPLGRDPMENSGVITFNMTTQGPLMSRRHCVLQLYGSRPLGISHDMHEWCALSVRDCGSLNGTFVNGRRLASGALSPPVIFDPCDTKVWKKPLMTLELGAGAKLATGESLSTRQLRIRLHVFVKCLVEGSQVEWIRRLLEGRCFFGCGPRDTLPSVVFDGSLVCLESVKRSGMDMSADRLKNKKKGEGESNVLLTEEPSSGFAEGVFFSAGIDPFPGLEFAKSFRNSDIQSVPHGHINMRSDDSLSFAFTGYLSKYRLKGGDGEGIASRLADVGRSMELSPTLLDCFTHFGRENDNTVRKISNKAIIRKNLLRAAAHGCSPVARVMSYNVESAGGSEKIPDSSQNCPSPTDDHSRMGLDPCRAPRLCDDGGGYYSDELLVSNLPILVKKRMAPKSASEQTLQKRRYTENNYHVSLSNLQQSDEEFKSLLPGAQIMTTITAMDDSLASLATVMGESLEVGKPHLPQEGTEVAHASLTLRDRSYSLPSSQEHDVIALPRHGIVKHEALTMGDDYITVSPTLSPLSDTAAEESQLQSAVRAFTKQKQLQWRSVGTKEKPKLFSDRSNWWS